MVLVAAVAARAQTPADAPLDPLQQAVVDSLASAPRTTPARLFEAVVRSTDIGAIDTALDWFGRLVRLAMTSGVALADLADEEFSREYAGWNVALRGALGASRAVERMASFGSTAPASVAEQIAGWRQRLGAAATP